jgi:hypothetical protein
MLMNGTSSMNSTEAGMGPEISPGLRAANRRLALGILLGMVALAAITIFAGLKSMPGRRARDARDPMAYLPADSNLVAMVEVSKVLQDEAGNELFNDFHIGGIGIAQVERWSGLARKELGILVVASHVDRQPVPRTVLVIQTLHPHPEKGVGSQGSKASDGRLASPTVLRGDKRLYQVAGEAGTPAAYLWCAAETVFVITLDPEDFDAVPDEPHRGLDYLDRDLCRLLIDRVPKDAEAFVAAHGKEWNKTSLSPYVDPFLGSASSNSLSDFCFWARFDKKIELGGSCRIASQQGMQAAGQLLKSHLNERVNATQTSDGWMDVASRPSAQDLQGFWATMPRR